MRGGGWLKTRVRTYLAYWLPRLALVGWNVQVRWRADKDLNPKYVWGSFDALAVRWPRRMDALLYFNLASIGRNAANDRAVEETVVHELVHVLTDLDEARTNTIARALVRERRGDA